MHRDEFITCAKLYTPNLLRFSRRIVSSAIQADDIVQESFIVLWKNREKVELKSAKAYLFAVAHLKIMESLRLEKRMHCIDNEYYVAIINPAQADCQELVQIALRKIPKLFQELLTLRDLESYSYKEIAEITRLTDDQVKVYLFRARKAIKEKILELEMI